MERSVLTGTAIRVPTGTVLADSADPEPPTRREYETVGYVIAGEAELHVRDQKVTLQPGDSWLVPAGASHIYKILEPFTAVEASSPPARVEARDES